MQMAQRSKVWFPLGEMNAVWALRVSNPRPPRCKRGALATELSARCTRQPDPLTTKRPGKAGALENNQSSAQQESLHRERAAAAAGALGTGIANAEAATIQVVVEINRHIAQVHQAALVDHD